MRSPCNARAGRDTAAAFTFFIHEMKNPGASSKFDPQIKT
jgi:hypothetical protein